MHIITDEGTKYKNRLTDSSLFDTVDSMDGVTDPCHFAVVDGLYECEERFKDLHPFQQLISDRLAAGPVDDDGLTAPILDPRQAVESWPIKHLGRRPKDYMARDLLLNSLWRDERPKLFHRMCRRTPAWIQDSVAHLPGNSFDQAAQFQALHFWHRNLLQRLTSNVIPGPFFDIGQKNQILNGLTACWPYGAQMEAPTATNGSARGCWCRMSWLCPWCYARRVVGLYDLLQRGPLKTPQGKHLILGHVTLEPDKASPDGSWERMWEDYADTSGYYLQSPQKVRRARKTMMGQLRRFASFMGIEGGLISHQIGPDSTIPGRYGLQGDLRGFRQTFTILGEVTFEDDDHKSLLQDCTCLDSPYCGSINLMQDRDLLPSWWKSYVLWAWHPADDPQIDALRLFLAGSSMNYPVRNLEWFTSLDARGRCLEPFGMMNGDRLAQNCVRGAFALQPNFMMDEVQWWSLAEATYRLPLYVPFGTWRKSIGLAKKEKKEASTKAFLPIKVDQTAQKRKAGLRKGNVKRTNAAQEEQDRLLEVAWPLYQKVVESGSSGRGRPAIRSLLGRALEREGYSVSEYRLKRLIKDLRAVKPGEYRSVGIGECNE